MDTIESTQPVKITCPFCNNEFRGSDRFYIHFEKIMCPSCFKIFGIAQAFMKGMNNEM